MKNRWSSFISRQLSTHPLPNAHLKTEKSSISSDGFLTIKWPEEVTLKGRIDVMDFLVATVTEPGLDDPKRRYPTAYQIADAMNKAEYYGYFLNNRKNGIVTFQDERILRRIHRAVST